MRNRRFLWLRDGCALRDREIGRALGQSEGAIKVVAHRARCAVREHFAAQAEAAGNTGLTVEPPARNRQPGPTPALQGATNT